MPSPSSLLLLVLLRGAPAMQPPTPTACEDLQRIELALVPAATAREICVSPGLMTGFLFDTPVEWELQDEARFVEVLRGRTGISFMPPRDMAPGERLRLTARLGGGRTQEIVTFTLVAHLGVATHQVEVYRDQRPREALQNEVLQERAKSQRLREELQQVRVQLERSGGLRELIANKTVSTKGVQTREFRPKVLEPSEGTLVFRGGVSYRTDRSVAAEVLLRSTSLEPWTAAGASLMDAHGKELRGMKLRQEEPIPPNGSGSVIVEVDATAQEAHGELTLKLWSEDSRGITIPEMTFP
ncbi:DUF2381 family protein [Vitiosangium sp. GDMCC 1.1324]|uniref:DUF2381 family protein n=1 Tax=Vitiosangium sp. (strain GDMCC 1.1324) TaxID=2138576 RepID=UPI000D3D6062|nr:DUF2381 family protein [Vitiosangium sp. GDMCC 1.1324]PTL81787.1 hypothetical protein DAT35_22885 [Vitiosangium sp. GDMCC 1.1324]